MRARCIPVPIVVVLACALAGAAPGGEPAAGAGDLAVTFAPPSGAVTIAHRKYGVILGNLRVRPGGADDETKSDAWTASAAENALTLAHTGGLKLTYTVTEHGTIDLVAEGAAAPLRVSGRCGMPAEHSMAAILLDQGNPAHPEAARRAARRGVNPEHEGRAPARYPVVVTQLGPAEVPGALSLFDRQRDLAITAFPEGAFRWARDDDGWRLESAGAGIEAAGGNPILSLETAPHYYRDRLRITYYTPIRKPSRWPAAPVLCMTWYGTHNQKLENLKPHIDWAAKHMVPYAGPSMVFQLDACYDPDDTKMREISDYIRSKGMVPGVWSTPHRVVPKDELEKHPEWFMRDRKGKFFNTFTAGHYKDLGPMLDTGNREVVEKHFAPWWRTLSETWNFDYFKIDGQGPVSGVYSKNAERGVEAYRRSLRIAREVVGDEKYINGCMGPIRDGIGILNGCRSGGDSGSDPIAWKIILGSLYLNNIVWYSDPDAAANLYKNRPEGRARVNALARTLTGQQFITDDLWTKVPDPVRRVWQQSFPMLDIRPVNLYPIAEPIETYDLRIARPWGTWDVVGVCNYLGVPWTKTLDLGLLPLHARRVHVFDYWASEYLGRFDRTAKLEFDLKEYDGRVLSLVPEAPDGRPRIVSTSRHLSQGGLELQKLAYAEKDGGWIVSGTSSHLVESDPYEISFAPGPYQAVSAQSSSGIAEIVRDGVVDRVRIVPAKEPAIDWQVTFAARTEPAIDVDRRRLSLRGNEHTALKLVNLSGRPARYEAAASVPWLVLSATRGEIPPRPAVATIDISADTSGLRRETVTDVELRIAAQGQEAIPVRVRVYAPEAANLALTARATASSSPDDRHGADNAVDGDSSTCWSPGRTEKTAWLELAWDRPVRFDSFVLHTDYGRCRYGPPVVSWRLMAGGADLKEVARGEESIFLNPTRFEKPVEASRLRWEFAHPRSVGFLRLTGMAVRETLPAK